ncbi:MAG: hypothetical protein Q7S02_01790 [bacterium]|nr:hypothetical protein [bacterium]
MAEEWGDSLLSWTFPEYEQHERGRGWYVAALVVAAALLVYAFASKNFLFAVIIVMLAVVFYLRHVQEPAQLEFAITERGILVGGRFIPYEGLQNFWIVAEDESPKKLYFHSRGVRPRFSVPLEGQELERVRGVLKAHLSENDERDEPTSDVIGRALKL